MRVLSLQTLKIFSLCSHVLYVMLSPSDNALSSISYCIFQYIIFSIRYRFTPFVSTILTRYLNSNMRKPAILFCSMPVLDISWNQYNAAFTQTDRILAFFLIPPFSSCANKQLSSASFGMMYMPVITTPRCKSNICGK